MSDIRSSLGVHFNRLYETIAITFAEVKSGKDYKPNCSCMGIRFLDGETFQMTPYINTDTYKNILEFPYVSINFISSVSFYAQAALIGENTGPDQKESSGYDFDHIDFKLPLKEGQKEELFKWPFLRDSWGTVLGKITQRKKMVKRDTFGEYKVLVGNFGIIDFKKRKESYDLINRADNLVLEAIILVTRLKTAKRSGFKKIYDKILKKIVLYKEEVERFSQNKDAIDTFVFVLKYIEENLKW